MITTNEHDAETARRIVAGDDAAFDRLYVDNVDRITGVHVAEWFAGEVSVAEVEH